MDSAAVPAFTLMVDCNNFYVSCERVFDGTLEGRLAHRGPTVADGRCNGGQGFL